MFGSTDRGQWTQNNWPKGRSSGGQESQGDAWRAPGRRSREPLKEEQLCFSKVPLVEELNPAPPSKEPAKK